MTIPDNLPTSVTRLQVVEINSRTAKREPAAPAKPSPPAVPASLDLQIAIPGPVFVRGHGLDSEWRGRISVTGTSDAPHMLGSLEAIRGTFDFLGKSFKVSRGNIGFDSTYQLRSGFSYHAPLGLQFSGLSNLSYTIQISSNLINWEMLGTATDIGNGQYQFEDTNTANFKKRFYRTAGP